MLLPALAVGLVGDRGVEEITVDAMDYQRGCHLTEGAFEGLPWHKTLEPLRRLPLEEDLPVGSEVVGRCQEELVAVTVVGGVGVSDSSG